MLWFVTLLLSWRRIWPRILWSILWQLAVLIIFNFDETTLAVSNQSITFERAVCDNNEVLKKMKNAKRAVKKVTHQGRRRFLRLKCLFTGFANGASTAPVIWLRCLPEGTVWEPFLTDEQGQVRRDERGRPLPGQHYCPVSCVDV